MVEANPVKFYLAKYLLLVFGSLLWLLALLYMFTLQSENHLLVAFLYFAFGVLLLTLNLVVNDKIRRVAIGRNKIVIIEGHRNIRFAWPEVKALRVIPVINLYRLRIRGKKKTFYFFPSRNVDSNFGQLAEQTSRP